MRGGLIGSHLAEPLIGFHINVLGIQLSHYLGGYLMYSREAIIVDEEDLYL